MEVINELLRIYTIDELRNKIIKSNGNESTLRLRFAHIHFYRHWSKRSYVFESVSVLDSLDREQYRVPDTDQVFTRRRVTGYRISVLRRSFQPSVP